MAPSPEADGPSSSPSLRQPYLILSVDGGGVRGLYAAKLLEMLEASLSAQGFQHFISNVRLFAGTSTGAILALGLASGLTPAELVALYRDHAEQIFPSRCRWFRQAVGLVRARYSNTALKRILQQTFDAALNRKDPRLGDIPRKVLVPTFELAGVERNVVLWKPKFFNNFEVNRGRPNPDLEQPVADVALRTTAAPTYLPVYQGFIDGGMVANNPSMAALAQALDADTGGQTLQNVRLFSLGTGENRNSIRGQSMNWGDVQWLYHKVFPDLVLDGMMEVADYQCRRILNVGRSQDSASGAYFRLAPFLPRSIALDDASATGALLRFAESVPSDPASKHLWLQAVEWWKNVLE